MSLSSPGQKIVSIGEVGKGFLLRPLIVAGMKAPGITGRIFGMEALQKIVSVTISISE
jgi:hypothetical protein